VTAGNKGSTFAVTVAQSQKTRGSNGTPSSNVGGLNRLVGTTATERWTGRRISKKETQT
jgi:hypothetical protein